MPPPLVAPTWADSACLFVGEGGNKFPKASHEAAVTECEAN
ncbi:hypothetical protein KAM344_41460 [Aeromonas caviae]|nr:hypothetical protein KAM344_41460 [Aeromonas caviae]